MTGRALCAILVVLILAAAAHAEAVAPIIYEQKDIGDPGLAEFVYSMSVDCTAATLTLSVMDENYSVVRGANSYLKYIDFSTNIISSVQTDNDGIALHKLPGNVKLMRGLFILVIEKYRYRNKEIHFDISPCYSNGTQSKPPKPPANQTLPANQSNASQGNQGAGNNSAVEPGGTGTQPNGNSTSNANNTGNHTQNNPDSSAATTQKTAAPCLPAALLIGFSLLGCRVLFSRKS
jgi:tRNA threonylcarbamoyladenosine modification (KEOPS) complex  Pcc1 subunit